jgi:hypothetical protein
MSKYPAQIDTATLPLVADKNSLVNADTSNRLRNAIIAIESELGIKPSGIYSTVRSRLDTIESLVSGVGGLTISGDVTGAIDSVTVVKLQGISVTNTTPTTNQVLKFNGTAWAPAAESGGGGSFTPGTDLSGTSTNQTVIGLNGILLDTTNLPPTGGSWLYNDGYVDGYLTASPRFRAKKSVMPGYYDVQDYGAIPDYLSGRKATINSGSAVATLSSVAGLHVGQKMRIAGVTGTKKILSFSGSTATFDSTANASVVAADIYTDNWDSFNAALAAMRSKAHTVQKLVVDGHYYLGHTLTITQAVHLIGSGGAFTWQNYSPGTWLTFPQNIDGIRIREFLSSDPGGASSGGYQSHFQDFTISCADSGSTTSGNGIHCTTTATFTNVHCEFFAERGFYLHAYITTPDGSADLIRLYNCSASQNGGNAFHVEGNEVNVCSFIGCSALSNGGVGFYDAASVGSTYMSCHSEGNTGHQYESTGGSNGATYINCYNEGSSNSYLAGPATVIGGTLGQATTASTPAFVLWDGTATRKPYKYSSYRGANRIDGSFGEDVYYSDMRIMQWGIAPAGSLYADPIDNTWLSYNGDSNPWVSFKSGSINREVLSFPTLIGNPRRPAPLAPNGIFLSDANAGTFTNKIVLSAAPAPSASAITGYPQTYEVGDFTINSQPLLKSALGFRCVTAGTINGFNYVNATGSITNGTNTLTLNGTGLDGLTVGSYITIVGISAGRKITAATVAYPYTSGTFTLNSNADATVSGAAIGFLAPTFEACAAVPQDRPEGWALKIIFGSPMWVPENASSPDLSYWYGSWGNADTTYVGSSWAGRKSAAPNPSEGRNASGFGGLTIGNNSLIFDGSTAGLTAPLSLGDYIDPSSGICSGIIVFNSSATTGPLLGFSGGAWGVSVGAIDPGRFSFFFSDGATIQTIDANSGSPGDDVIALFSYDGTNMEVSIDGGATWQSSAVSFGSGTVNASSAPMLIGTDGTNFFTGSIRDIRIVNTAYTHDQLASYARLLSVVYGIPL